MTHPSGLQDPRQALGWNEAGGVGGNTEEGQEIKQSERQHQGCVGDGIFPYYLFGFWCQGLQPKVSKQQDSEAALPGL